MTERGEFMAKLWLCMLKEGGRWRSKALAEKLREDAASVSQTLSSMAGTGYVRQFPVDGAVHRYSYGITPECRVPQGVHVQAIVECVLALPEEAA